MKTIIILLAFIFFIGKIKAENNPPISLHDHLYFGYSYTLASISKSRYFIATKAILLNEVQFINSRIYYGIQLPLNSKFNLRFTQYFKYVTFFDLPNPFQSNTVDYTTIDDINRIVTDIEFGFVRNFRIKKTNLNIGLSYRWFFIGSEYSYTYYHSDGSIITYNDNYNYDGVSLSFNYVNHNVELGLSFNLIPENHHKFPSVISKVILMPELKGLYIL